MANIAYLLTYADDDDAASQKSTIEEYARSRNLRIDNYITVEVPAARRERTLRVKELFSHVNRWDVVVIADLACMGSDMSDIITIAGSLSEKGVRFVAARQGIDLNGPGDGSSRAVTALFDTLLSVEKDLASRRIKGALAQKKKEGMMLGRPKGSISASKLDNRKDLIIEYLSKGVSKTSLARILETSPTNLASYLRTRKIVVAKKEKPVREARKDTARSAAPVKKESGKNGIPPTAPTQNASPVQFQETVEVLLCRHCGKNMHDPRTTTCAGGYIDYPNGESHPRVPYPADETGRCPRCGVAPGGYHHDDCYIERCPRCGERLVSCACRTSSTVGGLPPGM